jgi:hypothetical protein
MNLTVHGPGFLHELPIIERTARSCKSLPEDVEKHTSDLKVVQKVVP